MRDIHKSLLNYQKVITLDIKCKYILWAHKTITVFGGFYVEAACLAMHFNLLPPIGCLTLFDVIIKL